MIENIERNKKIYGLWKTGHTIDQISLITNIPRSTVGYYVEKFNKHQKNERTSNFEKFRAVESKENKEEILTTSFIKSMFFQKIYDLIKKGDFKKTYYFLASYKLFMELSKYFKLTPEELRALNEAFKSSRESVEFSSTTSKEPAKKNKTLDEIFGEYSER